MRWTACVAPAYVVRTPDSLGDTVIAQPALAGLRAATPRRHRRRRRRSASILRAARASPTRSSVSDRRRAEPIRPRARRRPARPRAHLPNSSRPRARAPLACTASHRLRHRRARTLLTDRVPLPGTPPSIDEYRLLVEALGWPRARGGPTGCAPPSGPPSPPRRRPCSSAPGPRTSRGSGCVSAPPGGPAGSRRWPGAAAELADRLTGERVRPGAARRRGG